MRRGSLHGPAVLAALLLLSLAPSPGRAQPDAVELRLRLAAGDALPYTALAESEATVEIAASRQTSTSRLTGREVQRILEVSPAGVARLEIMLEEMRIELDGRSEEIIDTPVLLSVGPDGRIVDGALAGQDFPFPLPDRAVRVGESWSRRIPVEESGVRGEATGTWTLAGVDRSAAGTVARLTSRISGQVENVDLGDLPPGAQARVRGTITGTGSAEWSVDRGRLLRDTSDMTMEMTVEIAAGEQRVQGRVRMRVASRRDPTTVAAPAVSAEFLIVPGQGVGAFLLAQPVSEITARLGEPAGTRPAEGARPGEMFWPSASLIAHTDPADPTRLVGLSTGDRRYRTDKGIGFGSSEGAVRLVYGPPPETKDVTVPEVGGIRYLIYDQQGIAYGITSDQAHAELGRDHAPVGVVDVIVVFPPGQGARVVTP